MLRITRTCGIVILCLLASLAGTAVRADIITVPGQHATIQAAVDACVDGDEVHVDSGVYSGAGNRNIDFDGKEISLIGLGGSDATIIDCGGSGYGLKAGTNIGHLPVMIQGFTIRNGVSGGNGGGIYLDQAEGTLQDIRIRNCHAALRGGGICLRDSDNVTITDLVIEECSADYSGGALNLDDSGGILIRDSLIRDNDGLGNEVIGVSHGGLSMTGLTLTENTGCVFRSQSSTLLIESSIFAFNLGSDPVFEPDAGSTTTVRCSDAWENAGGTYGGSMSDPTGTNGDIAANPYFCESAAQDYQLAADSPCLPANNSCGVLMGAFGQGCGAQVLYAISGVVLDGADQPVAGVEIVGGPVPQFTAADGSYGFEVPEGWSGVLTPVKGFWDFTPSSQEYVDVQSDLVDQDFAATRRTHAYIPDDFTVLSAAVLAAVTGDSILFRPGTYADPFIMRLDFEGKTLSLIGLDGPATTILDCGDGPHLWIDDGQGADFLIQGLTFANNDSWDQVIAAIGSSPTIRNCRIVDNRNFTAPDEALCPGVSLSAGSTALIEDCVFSGNQSSAGPALDIWDAAPVLNNVLFENNEGVHGGCVWIHSGSPEFNDCIFRDNLAFKAWLGDNYLSAGYGGALFINGGSPEFTGCLFAGNVAEHDTPNPFDENASSGLGGAIYVYDATASFASCTFFGNRAETYESIPGGAHIRGSGEAQVILEQCLLTDGLEGGGIRANGSYDPVLTCCDVWNNADGDYINMTDPTGTDGNISADPIYCGAGSSDFTVAANSPCLPENNTCGLLIGAYGQGCTGTAVEETAVPAATYLAANHPNPFNPTTKIAFGLVEPSAVTLRVYDAAGRLIATLLDGAARDAGRHEAVWTGRDDAGAQVSSGVYFYRLEAGAFSETRKMTLLK